MQNSFSQFRINNDQGLIDALEIDNFFGDLPQKEYIKNLFSNQAILEKLSKIIDENKNQNQVIFTREEIFVLLLLMYFGQIRNDLYNGDGFYISDMKEIKRNSSQNYKCQQKLKCITNYFQGYLKLKDQIFNQKVCFTRTITQSDIKEIQQKIINRKFEYKEIKFRMNKMEVYDNAVVVDFADKNIGGLSLGSHHLAQEEIMMLIHPEALISMLFIPPMQYNEAVLIENLIQFNSYEGYEATFLWQQVQKVQIHHLLAIDATPFFNLSDQITEEWINRELLKCFIGFDIAMKNQKNVTISTGKWGCGVFGGDVYLKSIIQITAFLMAAEENNSKNTQLIISTMNDQNLRQFGDQIKKDLHLNDCLNILEGLTRYELEYNDCDLSDPILILKQNCLQQQQQQ